MQWGKRAPLLLLSVLGLSYVTMRLITLWNCNKSAGTPFNWANFWNLMRFLLLCDVHVCLSNHSVVLIKKEVKIYPFLHKKKSTSLYAESRSSFFHYPWIICLLSRISDQRGLMLSKILDLHVFKMGESSQLFLLPT